MNDRTAMTTDTRDNETKFVACGGCDRELPVTRCEFENGGVERCPCGAGADLAFHNRHARWDDTDAGHDWS